MCSTVQKCRKTYLSQRDLRAHINYCHKRAKKNLVTRALLKRVHPPIASPTTEIREMLLDKDHVSHFPSELYTIMSPPPVQRVSHKHSHQPHEDLHGPLAKLSPPPPPLIHHETVKNFKRRSQQFNNPPCSG